MVAPASGEGIYYAMVGGQLAAEATQAMADDLFAAVESGDVKIHIDQRFALTDVQEAHRSLEARKTTGCSVLML